MAHGGEFSETDLAALVAHEIRQAIDWDQSEVSEDRSRTLEYLRGEMNDIPPRPNGSTVTSRDINDTIAWMLPGIMRVFMASDRMADFEPVLKEGVEPGQAEEQAEQASDYISYVFQKDNPGYRVVYNATHDALALRRGVVKHWWDETPETEQSHHTGLTVEQLVQLTDSDDIEVLSQEEGDPVQVTDEMGVPIEVATYNVKIRRTTSNGRVRVVSIEPENFLIDEAAKTIEDARFVAHRDPYVTRSDLIQMGFDREKVEALSADANFFDTEEGFSRHSDTALSSASLMTATQRIDYFECYLQVDVDDDGEAETIKVSYAGDAGAGEVLDWEVWEDDVPFTDIPCYPTPHRFDGESVADRTTDVQRIKTLLIRDAMDNLRASNLPQREVEQGSVLNPDSLVSPKFGGLIWKKPGSNPIIPHAVPFVADKAFAVLEYFDEVVSKRTGVSDTTMALDPQALQNQTATASQNARDAGYSQIELIARNMAELGWRRVFRSLLKLVVKHQDRPRTIRLRGEFVEMDPRHWSAGMDCTVSVGLGTGSRDRDVQMLQTIKNDQMIVMQKLAEVGFTRPAIEMLPRLRRTLVKSAEAAGLRDGDQFWPGIDDADVQALVQQAEQMKSQPSEAMQIAQAEMQVTMQAEQLKAEGNKVKEAAQLEADLRTRAADRENEVVREQHKAAMEQQRTEAHAQLELQKMAMAAAQKEQELAVKYDLELRKISSQEAARVEGQKDKQNAKNGADNAAKGLDKALKALTDAASLPRRVVRDEDGRIIGVETGRAN